MTKRQYHILLLEGQTTQGLACIHSLRKAGFNVSIFYSQKSYGYYSRFVKRKIKSPPTNSEEYSRFLLEYLEVNRIDVIMPMNDDVSPLVSKYKEQINKLSKVIIPDYDIFLKGYNKNELMKVCSEIDIPHPKTIDILDCNSNEAVNYVGLPAILKPNLTSGGRGMVVINSIDELNSALQMSKSNYGPYHLQKLIEAGGLQYKVQILIANGEPILTSVLDKQRFFPVKGGSSCCCTSVKHKTLIDRSIRILRHINWEGFADFDYIQDPTTKEFLLMEINPRVPACLKACIISGADFPVAITMLTLGSRQKKMCVNPGKVLRYLGFDILWFLQSKERFKSNPSWFSFVGGSTFYQDGYWNDPGPFVMGSLLSIKKVFSSSIKEKGMA